MTNPTTPKNVLRVDASMRRDGSVTRQLTDALVKALAPADLRVRDLADGISFVDEAWIGANFTAPEERTAEQRSVLAYSDALVDELKAADSIVIGAPIYNFGVPAALKAWIDMIARARLTFAYTADGPKGLLEGKTAYIVVASGGTPVGAGIDFATDYLKFALGFVGIHDVRIIDASDQKTRGEQAAADALAEIARNAAPETAAA